MSRRALEKVVDRAARVYLAKLGCCPPDVSAASGAEGNYWHAAFEEEVARAVRNSLAKQGIGSPCKPQAWLPEAKAASKAAAAAAAAAAEVKVSKAGQSSKGTAATGKAGSSSSSGGGGGSKANGSSKQAASSSSSGARAHETSAAAVANGADVSPADSSGASADRADKAASTGAVRIYRDDSSSSTVPKRPSPSRPPAGSSADTARYISVRTSPVRRHSLHRISHYHHSNHHRVVVVVVVSSPLAVESVMHCPQLLAAWCTSF